MSLQFDNKRIAKNSMFLYIRMFVLLVIALYTGRIVLAALGVEDYGIYNVIGGLITVFSFINNSMAVASQRFIAYELGSDRSNLQIVFSTSVYIHILMAVIVVILGETVGLWYVYNVAVIPPERFTAALYIYQFSIFIAVATIITVPYNALIIAHERMAAFAYLSLIEGGLKLAIAWLIMIAPFDHLIFYGLLMALVAILMRIFYGIYASRNFPESKLLLSIDRDCINRIGSFAGWSVMGSLAAVGYTHGLNLLLNLFFNPVVNAARGVAVTVQSVIRSFSGNFQMAVNPQITKSYAAGELDYMRSLVYKASRFTGCLYLLFALPVFIEIDSLLSLWLVEVPAHTGAFVRLLLMVSMIEVLASPLNVSAQATGKIRNFELVVGIVMLLIVPLSYLALRIMPIPELVFVIFLIMTIVAMIIRLRFAHRMIGLSYSTYFTSVILRLIAATIVGTILPALIYFNFEASILRLIAIVLTSLLTTTVAVYYLCMSVHERHVVTAKLKQLLHIF